MTHVAHNPPHQPGRDRPRPAVQLCPPDPGEALPAPVRSPATARAYVLAEKFAPSLTPVVLVGETGTGKTHLAEHIHRLSPRAAGPLVCRTAAEIVEGLAASQLFGHERGAFTGATQRADGMFTEADGGTLLLDDLHRMQLPVQSQLLRVLGSGVFRPLQAGRDFRARCRLIVAMPECPDRLVKKGVLLSDFRYRLGRCVVTLPPLCQRPEEIGPLAVAFLRRCPTDTGVPDGPARFGPDVVPALSRASWPGNLRDLKAAVERAYLVARGEPEVRLAHLDDELLRELCAAAFRRNGDADANRRVVEEALGASGGSQAAAARLLGVNRHTVRRYMPRESPSAES